MIRLTQTFKSRTSHNKPNHWASQAEPKEVRGSNRSALGGCLVGQAYCSQSGQVKGDPTCNFLFSTCSKQFPLLLSANLGAISPPPHSDIIL